MPLRLRLLLFAASAILSLVLALGCIFIFGYTCTIAVVQEHYYLAAIFLTLIIVIAFLLINYLLFKRIFIQKNDEYNPKQAFVTAQVCFGISIAVIGVNYYLQYASSLNTVTISAEKYTGQIPAGKTLCLHLNNYTPRPDAAFSKIENLSGSLNDENSLRTYNYEEAVYVMPADIAENQKFNFIIALVASNESDRKAKRSGSSPADWEMRFKSISSQKQQFFRLETDKRATALATEKLSNEKPLLLISALDEDPEVTRNTFARRVTSVASALLGISFLVTAWFALRKK
jgi:hypothetical protein